MVQGHNLSDAEEYNMSMDESIDVSFAEREVDYNQQQIPRP